MDWQLSLNRLIGSTKGTIGDNIKKAFVNKIVNQLEKVRRNVRSKYDRALLDFIFGSNKHDG